MSFCPACQFENSPQSKFCQKCGKPLHAAPSSGDATVRFTGQPLPQAAWDDRRRAIPVDLLFARKDRIVAGRAADCDICLPHPTVSRYHAQLERLPEGLRLRDLGSVNGITVGGQRLVDAVLVQEGERVGIGPFLFTLKGGVIHALDSSRSLRLEARKLEKVVPTKHGPRKLLDDINLVVEPGEFISLLGPSGSGKSTLMDSLNGRRRATGGQVLANGEDFYRHFNSFRQSLGYVPQKDIVHTQLTVYRALYYTASLRLPIDSEAAELATRVEEVLREMEMEKHRDTYIADLSGGQIKRVSLGAELLAHPCLLYIDEATSGLDAGTEAKMMKLFRKMSDEGRSIICITHNVDNVDRCHLALILARGRMMYYGPPDQAPKFFQVHRISEIYDQLLKDEDIAHWEKQFLDSELHQEYVQKRLASSAQPSALSPFATPPKVLSASGLLAGLFGRPNVSSTDNEATAPATSGALKAPAAPAKRAKPFHDWMLPILDPLHQFRVLTTRYAELIWGDRRSLRMLLLQAPIVALFLLAGFMGKAYEQSGSPLFTNMEPAKRQAYAALREVALLLARSAQTKTVSDEEREQLDAQLSAYTFEVDVEGVRVVIPGDQVTRNEELLKKYFEDPLHRKVLNALLEAASHLNPPTDSNETTPHPVDPNKVAITIRDTQTGATFSSEEILKDLSEGHKAEAVGGLFNPSFTNPRYTYMLLFIMSMIILWFGCNNAAKEIVKEEAIYGRERAVNLGIVPYLGSKFLVLGLISVFQVFLVMLIVYGGMEGWHAFKGDSELPPLQYRLSYLGQFGVLSLLSLVGVALGLLLSSCVSSPDRANALLPYVLIPQIILGGGIMPVKEPSVLFYIAAPLSPVYWAFRAIRRGATTLPPYIEFKMSYNDSVGLACAALLVQLVVLLLATGWFLRRKDAH
jgi:ABC-type multidrug transport system ATPase subunit